MYFYLTAGKKGHVSFLDSLCLSQYPYGSKFHVSVRGFYHKHNGTILVNCYHALSDKGPITRFKQHTSQTCCNNACFLGSGRFLEENFQLFCKSFFFFLLFFFPKRVHSKMDKLFMAQPHPDTKNTLQTHFLYNFMIHMSQIEYLMGLPSSVWKLSCGDVLLFYLAMRILSENLLSCGWQMVWLPANLVLIFFWLQSWNT